MGWADMIDIGTGEMERSEFNALRAVMAGQRVTAGSVVSTPRVDTQRYGMIEMTVADFERLKDLVAGRAVDPSLQHVDSEAIAMVDIGTGEMPQDAFLALKEMIKGKDIKIFNQLAACLP